MTPTLELKIFDDKLLNRQQLIDFLANNKDSVNLILMVNEGASLHQCGAMDIIHESGLAKKIKLDTLNDFEDIGKITHAYRYDTKKKFTSIFWEFGARVIKDHKFEPITLNSHYRLGCFIGRKNIDRLAIMYWLSKQPYDVLLSSLNEQIVWQTREDLPLWVDNVYSFEQWSKSFDIPSIDNYAVRDQYQNKDYSDAYKFMKVQFNLLRYYSSFDVELVAETFVRGSTFFPTEKTVRPIIGQKPFLVYGPKHYLTNLKKLGFRTFGKFWDESYDKYEGAERWIRMQYVIQQLNAWSDHEWQDILGELIGIIQHNKKIVENVPY